MKKAEVEKIYTAYVYVGNYEIGAYAKTKEDVISLIWKKYRKSGFDGFTRKDAFCEYHGLDADSVEEIEIGTAYIR